MSRHGSDLDAPGTFLDDCRRADRLRERSDLTAVLGGAVFLMALGALLCLLAAPGDARAVDGLFALAAVLVLWSLLDGRRSRRVRP